ncbi:MAG: DUF547 domain-containing protein [Pseudomonadota bacterium]
MTLPPTRRRHAGPDATRSPALAGLPSRRAVLAGLPSRRAVLAGAMATGGALALSRAQAAPASRLIDDRWTRFGGGGDTDNAAWARFLMAYLVPGGAGGVALVDYGAAVADRSALQGYIDQLQRVEPTTLGRDAAFAYWVNLYNAVTILLVLDAYPVDSIREVRGGLFNTGPWGDEVVRVEGQDLSLDDIEHGILRPVWRDPRIHYAVNCASIGCPDLAAEPYTATRLETMLDAGARAYAAHPRGADARDGEITVSKIYDWFAEDFGEGDERSVLDHLATYAPPGKAAQLAAAQGIDAYAYDWSLNRVGWRGDT